MRLFFPCAVLLLACDAAGASSASGAARGDEPAATPSPSSVPHVPDDDAGSGDGAVSKVADYNADLCGNGIDDDGNGLVDEACPLAKPCPLAIGAPLTSHRVRGLSFLHGTSDFIVYGDIRQSFDPPGIDRFVNGVASSSPVPLPAPYSYERIHTFPGGSITVGFGDASHVFSSRRLDAQTLAGTAGTLQGPATAKTGWAKGDFAFFGSIAARKSLWVVGALKGQTQGRVGRFDETLDLKATYDFSFIDTPRAVRLISLGGHPYVYDVTVSDDPFVARTRLVALGDNGPRFTTATLVDDWGTEVNDFGAGHEIVAQALDKILLCRGGPRRTRNGTAILRHEIDCHVVSASTGATLASFVVDDYVNSENVVNVVAAGHGPDFLFARREALNTASDVIHLDGLTANGVLTKDIATPSTVETGLMFDRLTETGPNEYALEVTKSDWDVGLVPIGCQMSK